MVHLKDFGDHFFECVVGVDDLVCACRVGGWVGGGSRGSWLGVVKVVGGGEGGEYRTRHIPPHRSSPYLDSNPTLTPTLP